MNVYELSGALFFGAADRIARIGIDGDTKCVVLRMRSVSVIDATAMNALEALYDSCAERGIVVIFSHVNKQPMHAMERAGLAKKVGAENFCAHIDDALAMAREIVT